MKTFNPDKIIFEAPMHKTMTALAAHFSMTPFMLRYNLGKSRHLSIVDKILKENKKTKKKSETSEIVLQNNMEAKQ